MISFDHVTKMYGKNMVGLSDATFTIKDQEFVFFVGKSGAGKSTLLRLLSLGMKPTKGCIKIDHTPVDEIPKGDIPFWKRRFGIVLQETGLLENKTVYENIAFVLHVTEQPGALVQEAVPKALGLMAMNKKAACYPCELSGGERLRVALSRALVLKPSYLVLDEPTANLDPGLGWDIMCLLREINYQGVTVLVASHDRELVNLMKKRVITLENGRIIGDVENARYGYLI